jgi:hypothetical protein
MLHIRHTTAGQTTIELRAGDARARLTPPGAEARVRTRAAELLHELIGTAGEEADACEDGHLARGEASRLTLRLSPCGDQDTEAVVWFGRVPLGRCTGSRRQQVSVGRTAWARTGAQLQDALAALGPAAD